MRLLTDGPSRLSCRRDDSLLRGDGLLLRRDRALPRPPQALLPLAGSEYAEEHLQGTRRTGELRSEWVENFEPTNPKLLFR